MKKLILLSLLFVIAFSTSPVRNAPPKWINSIGGIDGLKVTDNIKYVVGTGDGLTEALMNGLVQLCGLIHTNVKSNIKDEKFTSEFNTPECKIGKVQIQSMVKQAIEQFGKGDTALANEMYSSTYKMSYLNGDEKIVIKEYIEEVSEEFNYHYEMTSSNCSISDVITELKTQGVSIEDNYIDEMNYYLLLKAKVKNIKSE